MAANSRIGAEQFTVAKLLTDPAGGTATYDTPYAFTKKLIKLGVKNESSLEKQYADDQTVDVIAEDGDITISIDITDCTEDEKALLLGQTMVAGVRTPNPATDVRPYFCAMWKSKKRSGVYKYYKILKVMFEEPSEDFETKKEKTSHQPDALTGTGIQRIADGFRKRVADASAASWLAATGTNWFVTGDLTPDVTPPTVTVTPIDTAANQVATVNIVWTFDEAILPECVTAANFFVIKADGTPVPAALSIGTNDTVVTLNPTDPLDAGGAYISIATTGIKDKSGNALAANCTANFGVAA